MSYPRIYNLFTYLFIFLRREEDQGGRNTCTYTSELEYV